MSWEGHNYEDAIILVQRLGARTTYSLRFTSKSMKSMPGTPSSVPEEITRDIPNVSRGACQTSTSAASFALVPTFVPGDILVGKVTPKGETELTPEERLLRAIFGEKAREVRDTSLKVPHGESGQDYRLFGLRHGRRRRACRRGQPAASWSTSRKSARSPKATNSLAVTATRV